MMYVSGYTDTADILGSIMPVCLAKDSGTITMRLFSDPIPGVDVKLGKKWRSTKLYFYSGSTFSEAASKNELWNLGTIIPPPDTIGWMDINVPYDISKWAAIDTCGDLNKGVVVRIAVKLQGSRSLLEDGPDSGSGALLDNLCIDGQLVSGVQGPNNLYPLRIYPNPSSKDITVKLPEPSSSGMQIHVNSVAGNTLLSLNLIPGTTVQEVLLDALPVGLYFLQITSDGHVIASRKLVKLLARIYVMPLLEFFQKWPFHTILLYYPYYFNSRSY